MLEIRRYRPEDRAGVRQVCVETAFLGASILPQYSDVESFADMFTGYYTDHEPESAWVVTDGERVLGYLLGCMDSRNSPAPEWVVFKHIMRRWLWLRPGTAGFCFRCLFDVLRDLGPTRPPVDYVKWPAHSHLDLLPEARKGPTALRLFRLWLDAARERGAVGMWGASIVENEPATVFHRATGFHPAGEPFPATGMRTPAGTRMHAQIWVRALQPAAAALPVPAVSARVRAPARSM
jgi:hypothetical protein